MKYKKEFSIALLAFFLGLLVMYFVQQQYVKFAQNNTKNLLNITRSMENRDNNLINEDDKLIEILGNCMSTPKTCDIDKAAVMAYNHHNDRLNLTKDRKMTDTVLSNFAQ
jgi:hypothetical protein